MQTSRFQLGLIATLAIGLGFSLASSDAVGYPAGAAVSMGANPVASFGGTLAADPVTVFSAADSGPFLVTDVVLSMYNCGTGETNGVVVSLEDSETGDVYARYGFSMDRDSDGGSDDAGSNSPVIQQSYTTGVVIPAGKTAVLQRSGGSCTSYYSLAGYQAQG
jgi:hypothetical protein